MANRPRKKYKKPQEVLRRYSIYDRTNDQPVVIHATAEECAEVLGIETRSFYSYVSRQRRASRWASKRYEIFVDEDDEEDDADEMDLR